MREMLLSKCNGIISNVRKVLFNCSVHELEQFHEQEIGDIPPEAKKHSLYIPTLFLRCSRFLEQLVRENNGEEVSSKFKERNIAWVQRPILDVLENPPTDELGLAWRDTAFIYFPTWKIKGAKRISNNSNGSHRRGFRRRILEALKKRGTCSISDIIADINDPELKEKYVKMVLYQGKKKGAIESMGRGVFKWKGDVVNGNVERI